MTLSPQLSSNLSLEEFLQLPETKPASEYIDGKIFQKPMPQGNHSTLQIELASDINRVGKPEKLAYAFPELRCTFGGKSIVPDIAVFEWDRIPLDTAGKILNQFEIPPDWTIEILSPNQSPNRVISNITFAIQNGTKLVWFLDPDDGSIMIFQPNQLPEFKQEKDILPVLDVFKDWNISVEDVFACLNFS